MMGPRTGEAPEVLEHARSSQGDQPHKTGAVGLSGPSPAPRPSQVLAECVLCPAAREPWLLQGCEGSQRGSAIPRGSACQPGQGPGQCRL